MAACKDETIKGFNGYIKELRKQKNHMLFTLTQFDSIDVDIVHDGVPLDEVKLLNDTTYEPRANTPLYDAIGKTVRATEVRVGDKYKVLFVTLTDGQENSSSEWTKVTINELIKEMEGQRNWTFAHIGVGANGWAAAQAYSYGTQSASNVLRSDHKDTAKAYRSMARATTSYAANIGASSAPVMGLWKEDEE